MKTLYKSLLDDLDTIEKNSNDDVIPNIEDFIKKNYRLDSGVKYTISSQLNENGKYVVDVRGRFSWVKFIGKGDSLTNGLFEFGELYGCGFDCSESNISSLIGAPKTIICDGSLHYFDCSNCKNLRSLEGGSVMASFKYDCSNCKNLRSLEGAPKDCHALAKFDCSGCTSLKSLKGGPDRLDRGSFKCSGCTSLKTLEGSPVVYYHFDCSDCTSLKSLKGIRNYRINSLFDCSGCTSLETLEGGPDVVVDDFNCSGCTSLESLEGGPKEVRATYNCTGCTSLKSLKGSPKETKQLKIKNCPKLKNIDYSELGGNYPILD